MIKNKGFTLIEMMIVVAIISILLAIAVPTYQDYQCMEYNDCEGISQERIDKLKNKTTDTIEDAVDQLTGDDPLNIKKIDQLEDQIAQLRHVIIDKLASRELQVIKTEPVVEKSDELTDAGVTTESPLPESDLENINPFYTGKIVMGKDGNKYIEINDEQFEME